MRILPAAVLVALSTWGAHPAAAGPAGLLTAPVASEPPVATPLKDLNVSPFEAIEWDGTAITRVKVHGAWYELLDVNGWSAADLLAFARDRHGPSARQRVEEDLPQLLIDAGRPPAATVSLRLRSHADDQPARGFVLDVEMTKDKRRVFRDARRARERADEAHRPAPAPVDEATLATEALREFRELLTTRHSYSIAASEGPRLVAMVDKTLNSPEKPTLALAALTIERVLGASRDGHARMATTETVGAATLGRFAPCLFVPLGDEPGTPVIAVKPDRSGLLDPAHPFVVGINGADIEDRLKLASDSVAEGSPALVRERSCRQLRSLGVVAVDRVTIMLSASPDSRTDTLELTAPAASSSPRYGEWPRRESGWLNDSVAYLRLGQMSDDPADLKRIEDLVASFDKATGLVVDVRGNGGGSRDALMLLASRFMAPSADPIVFNAARPLALGDTPAGVDRRMDTRFLRRADDPRWTDDEREAVAKFVATFKPVAPGVHLDGGAFGPWYYGVLTPDASLSWRRPGRRVVVLMDNVCFSATDVFLAAMKRIDGVTLIGRDSAGGSGMAISHPLAQGAITVNLSSMVSFQPDGTLFDGVGVKPHIYVTPRPMDFINAMGGGTDTTLDRALAEIARPSAP